MRETRPKYATCDNVDIAARKKLLNSFWRRIAIKKIDSTPPSQKAKKTSSGISITAYTGPHRRLISACESAARRWYTLACRAVRLWDGVAEAAVLTQRRRRAGISTASAINTITDRRRRAALPSFRRGGAPANGTFSHVFRTDKRRGWLRFSSSWILCFSNYIAAVITRHTVLARRGMNKMGLLYRLVPQYGDRNYRRQNNVIVTRYKMTFGLNDKITENIALFIATAFVKLCLSCKSLNCLPNTHRNMLAIFSLSLSSDLN